MIYTEIGSKDDQLEPHHRQRLMLFAKKTGVLEDQAPPNVN